MEGKVLATVLPWKSSTKKKKKGIHSDYSCACVLTHSCVRLGDHKDCGPSSSVLGFSRQEYWSGLPLPSPAGLPHPGIEPRSLHLLYWQTGSLPRVFTWEVPVQLCLPAFHLPPVFPAQNRPRQAIIKPLLTLCLTSLGGVKAVYSHILNTAGGQDKHAVAGGP